MFSFFLEQFRTATTARQRIRKKREEKNSKLTKKNENRKNAEIA